MDPNQNNASTLNTPKTPNHPYTNLSYMQLIYIHNPIITSIHQYFIPPKLLPTTMTTRTQSTPISSLSTTFSTISTPIFSTSTISRTTFTTILSLIISIPTYKHQQRWRRTGPRNTTTNLKKENQKENNKKKKKKRTMQ